MQARIGVAAAQAQLGPLPVHAVNRVYVTAVRAAQAIPFIIPILDPGDALAVVAELDGLVLSGGGDFEPAAYGAVPGPGLYGVDAERDRWELALVTAAEELGVPVLGVCRGLQALNVAAGGTLLAHLPDLTDQAHRVPERDREPVHSVTVAPGSLLHQLTGPSCAVNSLHHQAADRVGTGLRAVAHAPDGVVEALEDTRGGRTLGVQWHPELLPGQPEQAAVWSWLIDAAGTWRLRRRGVGRTSMADNGGNLAAMAGAADPSGDVMLPDSRPIGARISVTAGQAA